MTATTYHITVLEDNSGQAKPGFVRWRWRCTCGQETDYKFATPIEAKSAAFVHRKANT